MSHVADAVLWFHIVAGAAALLVGAFSLLLTRKGTAIHIGTGRAFWYSMVAMAYSGIVVAVLRPKAAFVLIGLLSLYLVHTGRHALRRPRGAVNRDTVFWFAVAVSCLGAGIGIGSYGLLGADGHVFGSPSVLYLGAAFDAAIFVVLDWRLMRIGSATGSRRIVDHVWRMIAALLFATFALFIANPSVFPQWFTAAGFNFIPPLLLLVLLVYWVLAVKRGWWKGARPGSAKNLQHEFTT
ncbi:MAG TPA: hypothetical protein VIZ30_05445 [Pseudomonadales bacterium]